MKKLGNKGFTLIELLAVIIVLAIILAIAVPQMTKLLKNIQDGGYEKSEEGMIKAVESYLILNIGQFPAEEGDTERVLLSTLVNQNYIKDILDVKDESVICTGYVDVTKLAYDGYEYTSYLECGDNYASIIPEVIPEIFFEVSLTDVAPGIMEGEGTLVLPWQIESIEDLAALGKQMDEGGWSAYSYYEVLANLDFENPLSYHDSEGLSYVNGALETVVWGDINEDGLTEGLLLELTTGKGFNPIGGIASFESTFNGNDKIIKNLYINRPLEDYVGLFDYIVWVSGTSIKNITLESVDITGQSYTGALIAFGDTIVENVSVTGTVVGDDYVGGIVGKNDGSDFTDVSFVGTVSGVQYVGGIIAYNSGGILTTLLVDATITGDTDVGGAVGQNSGNMVDAVITSVVTGVSNVGGALGRNYAWINNSSVTTTVNGETDVGGFVGQSDGDVVNSSATGDITGLENVGGLAGRSIDDITNCYSKGTVTGDSYVGGLVGKHGENLTDTEEINNSYSNSSVTGAGIYKEYMGSLVGWNYAIINNSYATGAITTDRYSSGLVGRNYGPITNTYSTGAVTGYNDYAGGLLARNFGAISNSYTTSDVTGLYEVGPGIGLEETGSTSLNTYYYDGATCDGDDCIDGVGSVNLTNLKLSSWHTGTLGWTTEWELTDDYYPKLYKQGTTVLIPGQTDVSIP